MKSKLLLSARVACIIAIAAVALTISPLNNGNRHAKYLKIQQAQAEEPVPSCKDQTKAHCVIGTSVTDDKYEVD